MMSESKGKIILAKIENIAANSTAHGIANIVKTERTSMKVIWLLSLLVSASFCFYLEQNAFLEYLNYPVTTKIRYINEKSSQFPAIAICNTNPFLTNYSIDTLVDFLEENSNFSYAATSNLTKLEYVNRVFDGNAVSNSYN